MLIGDGATESCAISPEPSVDVVAFGATASTDLHPAPPLLPTVIGGHQAQTGTEQLPDGRTATALIVPDLDVSVTVKSKDAGLVAGILATAQIVDTDANGCTSRMDSVEPAGKPVRPGAQSTMVPGKPVTAIVCHYAAPRHPGQTAPAGPALLASGSGIAPDRVGELAAVLNSLKPGLATWQGLAGSCPSAAHDGYVLRFGYASGAPVDVYLHSWNCDHMGFSNGAVTGYISPAFMAGLQNFLPGMGFVAAGEAVR
ncbi:MAG: hypothetical protein HOV83_24700 [Catenulispora sp.]|nr:hypothetical protein [Catenulispora sp.]